MEFQTLKTLLHTVGYYRFGFQKNSDLNNSQTQQKTKTK